MAQSPRLETPGYWGSYRGTTSQATSGKRLYRALCLVEYPGCSTAPVESRARSKFKLADDSTLTLTRTSPSPARKRAPWRVTTLQLNYSSLGTSEDYVAPMRPDPGGPMD